jgi:hypothetical protein
VTNKKGDGMTANPVLRPISGHIGKCLENVARKKEISRHAQIETYIENGLNQ